MVRYLSKLKIFHQIFIQKSDLMNLFISNLIFQNHFLNSPLFNNLNNNYNFYFNINKKFFNSFGLFYKNFKIKNSFFNNFLNNCISINSYRSNIFINPISFNYNINFSDCIFENSTNFQNFLLFSSSTSIISIKRCGFRNLFGNYAVLNVVEANIVEISYTCFEKAEASASYSYIAGYFSKIKNWYMNNSLEFNNGHIKQTQYGSYFGAINNLIVKDNNSSYNFGSLNRCGICIIDSPSNLITVSNQIIQNNIGPSVLFFLVKNIKINLFNILNNTISNSFINLYFSNNNIDLNNFIFYNNSKKPFGQNNGIINFINCSFDLTLIEINNFKGTGINIFNPILITNYNTYLYLNIQKCYNLQFIEKSQNFKKFNLFKFNIINLHIQMYL